MIPTTMASCTMGLYSGNGRFTFKHPITTESCTARFFARDAPIQKNVYVKSNWMFSISFGSSSVVVVLLKFPTNLYK